MATIDKLLEKYNKEQIEEAYRIISKEKVVEEYNNLTAAEKKLLETFKRSNYKELNEFFTR